MVQRRHLPFASCLRGALGEDENGGMRHGVSPPAPWGSSKGEGRANGSCWCGESMCKLPALQQPTVLTLHNIKVYINSVKGNSFQRRVCLCNFSQDRKGNTACTTLLCMCTCLSGSLQCTQELKTQIFLQREFGLQGEGEGIGTDPSFIFSIATE